MSDRSAASTLPGLRHPLAEAFLAFSLLPSLNLDATQAARLAPEAALRLGARLPSLHRHWSAALIAEPPLTPLPTLDDPALPLAMLPPGRFERGVLMAGVLLAGRRIRHSITHHEVALWQTQLGDAALEFARRRAPGIHPGLAQETCADWPLESAAEGVTKLGSALLAHVFSAASPAVGQRGLLRLPAEAVTRARALPFDASEALPLSLSLLQEIEPEWLSLFPATL